MKTFEELHALATEVAIKVVNRPVEDAALEIVAALASVYSDGQRETLTAVEERFGVRK